MNSLFNNYLVQDIFIIIITLIFWYKDFKNLKYNSKEDYKNPSKSFNFLIFLRRGGLYVAIITLAFASILKKEGFITWIIEEIKNQF